METGDIIQFTLASIALVISVGAALFTANVGKTDASSDYVSPERVKSGTARLLASLRSIATKGFDAAPFEKGPPHWSTS